MEDSRYLHRGKFIWEDAEKREDPDTIQGRFFTKLKRLEGLRAEEDAFASDAEVWTIDTWDNSILGMVRQNNNHKLIALFNFSEYNKTAWINEGLQPFMDLISGELIVPRDVYLPAYGFCWLLSKEI